MAAWHGRHNLKPLLAFLAGLIIGGLACIADCRAQAIGVNLTTAHASGGYRSWTPGLYARSADGLTGGILRNSEGDWSAHAGYTWHTAAMGMPLDIQAGAISGYRRAPVLPMASVSVLLAEHHRAIWIPGPRGGAMNYAWEWK